MSSPLSDAVRPNTCRSRDRQRRCRIVAGNHDDPDACVLTLLDRFGGVDPQRIGKADEAEKFKFKAMRCVRQFAG